MSGRTFLLQDWVTVRSSLTQPLVQDPACWLDLEGFSDAVAWIDVTEVTPPGANTSLALTLQTAPSADDSYFVPLAPSQLFGSGAPYNVASSAPLVVRSARTTTTNDLMRYLRWSIAPMGSTTPWDLTFRVRVIAARSTAFVPPLLPSCQLWLRPDMGITVSGAASSVTAWNDVSGVGDTGRNLTAGSTNPTLNLADANFNYQPTVSFAGSANCYFTSGTFGTPLSQPLTWIIVANRTSATGTTYFFDGDTPGTGGALWDTAAPGNNVTGNLGSVLATTASYPFTSPSVVLFEVNGTHSNIFVNNFTTTAANGPIGSNGFNSLTLGAHSIYYGGGSNWPGTFAEVIVYGAILSANQKGQLRSYLRGRYGLTVN